jgi:hypothetical protein
LRLKAQHPGQHHGWTIPTRQDTITIARVMLALLLLLAVFLAA